MRIFLSCIIFISMCVSSSETYAFSNQIMQRGATGEDVIELQARLQYIGFYKGKINGAFGWSTYWAVKNFQKKYKLPGAGVVGKVTKTKLTKATKYYKSFVREQIAKGNTFTHYGGIPLAKQVKVKKKSKLATKAKSKAKPVSTKAKIKQTAVNVPKGFSQNDMNLLANAVYGESRGEPYVGQVAVAAVVLNRLENPAFPKSVSSIIFEPGAFTAVADGQIWLTPNESAKKAVLDAMNGWDPSNGAIYYFNPSTATSKWIWSREQIKTIGKHIFCE